MKTVLLVIEVEVEVEGEYKPGKEAVMPHGGNPDGTPPEGPEIKLKKVMFPAQSKKQVDILPYLNAETLNDIEDDYLEQCEQEDDDG
jgi:hypothetical protein